jgi:hypothetical protein
VGKKARALVLAEGSLHGIGGALAAALVRDAQGRPSLLPGAEAQAATALDALDGPALAEAVEHVLELAQLVERELGAASLARRLVGLVRTPVVAARVGAAWAVGDALAMPGEPLEALPAEERDGPRPAEATSSPALRPPAPPQVEAPAPEPAQPSDRGASSADPRRRGPGAKGDLSLTLRHPRRV